MPDDLGELENRIRQRIKGFKSGDKVKVRDGFDGWIKTEIEQVEIKNGAKWYKCKGILRLFPENMLKTT